MNRLIAAGIACVISLFPIVARALTLEPLPGSTPQTTCLMCVFPTPIGIIARDASGSPVAGVPVTFTTQTNTVVMVDSDDTRYFFDQVVVSTGADGRAIATALTVLQPSEANTVTAAADGAADVNFVLSSTTRRATTVSVVSGNNQFVQAGAGFPASWVVRVTDANGAPVANTLMQFAAHLEGYSPYATFDGAPAGFAVSDANGIAVSPPLTASIDTGDNHTSWAQAWGFVDGEVSPSVPFEFHVVPYAVTTSRAMLVAAPPDSLQVGTRSPIGYKVRMVDASGAPAVGMPVLFTVSDGCGTFDNDFEQTVIADANGLAQSAPFEGDGLGVCTIYIYPAGVKPFQFPIHVYDPNAIVVTAHPSSVVTHAGDSYRIIVEMTESGLPIQPPSIESVTVLPDPQTARAGIRSAPAIAIIKGFAMLDFRANPFPGSYALQISVWGPSLTTVPVTQLPHGH